MGIVSRQCPLCFICESAKRGLFHNFLCNHISCGVNSLDDVKTGGNVADAEGVIGCGGEECAGEIVERDAGGIRADKSYGFTIAEEVCRGCFRR